MPTVRPRSVHRILRRDRGHAARHSAIRLVARDRRDGSTCSRTSTRSSPNYDLNERTPYSRSRKFEPMSAFLLDRIVVAIDAVGEQRIARNHRVLIELDRIQPDDRGVGAAIPFEWRRALCALAGRDGLGEYLALDERLHGAQLHRHFPLDVKGGAKACDDQQQQSDDGSLKSHFLALAEQKQYQNGIPISRDSRSMLRYPAL